MELTFFFPHVSSTKLKPLLWIKCVVILMDFHSQLLRVRVETDYKRVPVVQLAAHAKSSTLCGRSYGRTYKFYRLDGLLLFCIIMGLRFASSAIKKT